MLVVDHLLVPAAGTTAGQASAPSLDLCYLDRADRLICQKMTSLHPKIGMSKDNNFKLK